MGSGVVEVRDVCVDLGGISVVDRVSVSAGEGEVVALTGPNGAGKSTLIRCVAGVQRPTSGSVEVFGGRPDRGSGFWRLVGLAAEEPAWYPGLTVREHLELIARTHASSEGAALAVQEALAVFGIADRADAAPSTLSTGQRQRLALAAVLVRPSRLLLLDEPEQGLDTAFRRRFAELLCGYVAGGGSVVMATHDVALVESTDARQVVLTEGRIAGPAGGVVA